METLDYVRIYERLHATPAVNAHATKTELRPAQDYEQITRFINQCATDGLSNVQTEVTLRQIMGGWFARNPSKKYYPIAMLLPEYNATRNRNLQRPCDIDFKAPQVSNPDVWTLADFVSYYVHLHEEAGIEFSRKNIGFEFQNIAEFLNKQRSDGFRNCLLKGFIEYKVKSDQYDNPRQQAYSSKYLNANFENEKEFYDFLKEFYRVNYNSDADTCYLAYRDKTAMLDGEDLTDSIGDWFQYDGPALGGRIYRPGIFQQIGVVLPVRLLQLKYGIEFDVARDHVRNAIQLFLNALEDDAEEELEKLQEAGHKRVQGMQSFREDKLLNEAFRAKAFAYLYNVFLTTAQLEPYGDIVAYDWRDYFAEELRFETTHGVKMAHYPNFPKAAPTVEAKMPYLRQFDSINVASV